MDTNPNNQLTCPVCDVPIHLITASLDPAVGHSVVDLHYRPVAGTRRRSPCPAAGATYRQALLLAIDLQWSELLTFRWRGCWGRAVDDALARFRALEASLSAELGRPFLAADASLAEVVAQGKPKIVAELVRSELERLHVDVPPEFTGPGGVAAFEKMVTGNDYPSATESRDLDEALRIGLKIGLWREDASGGDVIRYVAVPSRLRLAWSAKRSGGGMRLHFSAETGPGVVRQISATRVKRGGVVRFYFFQIKGLEWRCVRSHAPNNAVDAEMVERAARGGYQYATVDVNIGHIATTEGGR